MATDATAAERRMIMAECFIYRTINTNADKIRAMSDEELAAFLNMCESMGYEDSSIATDSSGHCMDMLEWLKQPAE